MFAPYREHFAVRPGVTTQHIGGPALIGNTKGQIRVPSGQQFKF